MLMWVSFYVDLLVRYCGGRRFMPALTMTTEVFQIICVLSKHFVNGKPDRKLTEEGWYICVPDEMRCCRVCGGTGGEGAMRKCISCVRVIHYDKRCCPLRTKSIWKCTECQLNSKKTKFIC